MPDPVKSWGRSGEQDRLGPCPHGAETSEGRHLQSKLKLGQNGLPQPDGQEGFSEEEVFKGAIGEAEEAATAAWGGENFKQRESGSTALRQEPPLSPRSISPGPGPGKGQVGPGHPFPWLCLLRGRVPGADGKPPGKPICAVAHLQQLARCNMNELGARVQGTRSLWVYE